MRLIYFLFFILKADYKKVWQSIKCLRGRYAAFTLLIDALWCSFFYGTSLNDYFNFRFFEKQKEERITFASTLFMYKFHKALNQKEYISRVDNKEEFRRHYQSFAGPSMVFEVNNEEGKKQLIGWLNKNNYEEVVIKDPLGTTGKSVVFFSYKTASETFQINGNILSKSDFCKKYSIKGKIYIEPNLKQHPLIHEIAPTALNTIRVITVLRKDGMVDLISAAFRISVNSETDNFSTGNLAAAVDIETGIVISPGIKRLAACSESYIFHPVTKVKILGFQIPFWTKVIAIAREAAKVIPQVRTVGWDVAILEDRPIIIEGNPSWNKGAPQIPLDKGIKPILEKYL